MLLSASKYRSSLMWSHCTTQVIKIIIEKIRSPGAIKRWMSRNAENSTLPGVSLQGGSGSRDACGGATPHGNMKPKSLSEQIPDWCVFFVLFFFSAIDYIHFLHKEKKKQEEEVSVLRKEVTALKIMKTWDNGSPTFSSFISFSLIHLSTKNFRFEAD